MREIKTVALIGLGAIGSFIATKLVGVLGEDLRIVADGERKERIEKDGIIMNGERYDFHVVRPDEKMEPADLVIIITKIMGLKAAIKDVKNQIGENTIIMAPLNGVEAEDIVAKEYGYERILYSLARVSVVMKGNVANYGGDIAFLEFGEKHNEVGHYSKRVIEVKDLFEKAELHYIIQKDMIRALWLKYMCNVGENQCAALLGVPFGAWSGVSEHADAVRIMLMKEVVAIANAKGIDLTEEDILSQNEKLKKIPYANKPSTLQDIEAGRKTEVDMFSGTIIRYGKELNIPTPVNEVAYHGIKVLEEKNAGII